MNCEYVQQYYGVPAVIGRRVIVDGRWMLTEWERVEARAAWEQYVESLD